jgi:glutathione S-transferase
MKLYDYAPAPNPRRVRMFLAEKGIAVPTVQVDLRANAQFAPEFRAINPDCTVPVLELDDGTRLADVMAICVYFEVWQPEPALMGSGPLGSATVAAWQRQVERDGFFAVAEALRNSSAAFKGRALPGADDYEQIPALVERGRARVLPHARRAPRCARIRRRRTVLDRRHHRGGCGRFRPLDQAHGP